MTLPALLEFQKITAAGLRAFEAAGDNPEGFALLLAETLHDNDLEIVRATNGLRQEPTKAASSAAKKASAKTAKNAEEVDE